jgi:replicative DNA helicase
MNTAPELPINAEAERGTIGILLADPELVQVAVGRLTDKSFGNVGYLSIWRHIKTMWSEGKPIMDISVIEAMRANGALDAIGGPSLIFEAEKDGQRFYGSGDKYLPGLCDTLSAFRKARAGVLAAHAVIAAARVGDIPKMQSELENGIREAADNAEARKGMKWKEIGLQFTEKDYKKLKGIATGYPFLDNYFGGLIRGKLMLIAGGAGDGKSTIALCILLNAVRFAELKEPALIFSQEMNAEENWTRGMCFEKGVRSGAVASGLYNNYELKCLKEYLNEDLPVTVFDDCQTLAEIIAEIRIAVMRDKARLVIVDYIQIVDGEKKDGREREVAEIGRSLKLLAQNLQITIIGLTQVNDDGLVRESRALKQHCDQMLQIFVNPDDDTIRRLRIQKNRGGKRYVSCDYKFIGENFSFVERGEVEDTPPETPNKKGKRS